jgi:hypothetical protein
MLVRFALVSCILVAGFAAEVGGAGLSEPGLHSWTNSPPRAFLKDRHLRLYSGVEGERVLFETEWKKSRVAALDFSYTGATLQRDTSPPALPDASSSWREIKVVDVAEGDRLLRAFATRLVPAEPGHGVYLQHALGDACFIATPPERHNGCRSN